MTGPSTVPYLFIFTVTCELTDSRQLVNGPQLAPFWRLMTRWHGGLFLFSHRRQFASTIHRIRLNPTANFNISETDQFAPRRDKNQCYLGLVCFLPVALRGDVIEPGRVFVRGTVCWFQVKLVYG